MQSQQKLTRRTCSRLKRSFSAVSRFSAGRYDAAFIVRREQSVAPEQKPRECCQQSQAQHCDPAFSMIAT